MRSLALLTIALGCLLAGCAQPSPPSVPKPDLAAEEKAIRDLDAQWLKAVASRDASAEAAVFAEDGVAYREHNNPIVGPAAYQAFQAKFYADNPMASTTWSTDAVRVAESGDMAIQTGETHVTNLGAKGDREDRVRFVTVWRKVNGQWKAAHDIGVTILPEPTTEKK